MGTLRLERGRAASRQGGQPVSLSRADAMEALTVGIANSFRTGRSGRAASMTGQHADPVARSGRGYDVVAPARRD